MRRGNAQGRVRLVGLVKNFGERIVVDDVNLEIASGEFFSLLGPSGCGKTTTLRMIGGFESPDSGRILIDDRDVTDDEPEVRPLNTVFQNYALFPHLNVFDNVAFGLRFEDPKPATEKVRERVMRALDLVALGSFAERKVPALSGGEQQRVALARALVLEPSVLLLDEPLGALDAQLRARLQVELANLQRQIGITFVYVTHDQHEAFTMSDRIGVMREGKLVQVGTPREIYETPATVDVARFVGAANVIDATVVAPGSIDVGGVRFAAHDARHAGVATVMIRPERIHVGTGETPATIERITFAGSILRVALRVGTASLVAEVPNDERSRGLVDGQATTIEVLADAVRVLGAN